MSPHDEQVDAEAPHQAQRDVAGTHPHRNVRPVIIAWIVTLVLEGMVYWLRSVQPVMSEILRPAFILAAVPGVVGTWHWLHRRSKQERRSGDRRHERRRH